MAVVGDRLVTLLDVSRKTKNKAIGDVAEVLVQKNAMLIDMPYQEMNEGTQHTEEIRSALPEVFYRRVNEAIPASKTTTEERSFGAAHVESKSQMDELVAKRGGEQNIGYNRWNQAQGHLQAHSLELAKLMVYGSPISSPRKTPGFFDYYATVNTATDETAKQVIDAGGTGSDNTSILLANWGPRNMFGIYPAGTDHGIQRIDRSPNSQKVQIQAIDIRGNQGSFWGYEENFILDHGLVVKDYRQGGRICNIDVLNLKSGNAAADLFDMLISLVYKIDSIEDGTPVLYVNRTLQAFLHKQSRTTVGAGAGLTYQNYQGKPVLTFLDIPIRRSDAILNTEARVV